MIFLTSGLTLVRNVDNNFGEIVVEQDISFEGADNKEVKTETLSFGLETGRVDCSWILEAVLWKIWHVITNELSKFERAKLKSYH